MSQLFSGLPFGTSIYFVCLLGLLVASAFLLLQVRSRRTGAAILTLIGCLLIPEILTWNIDHNPLVKGQELVGLWRDGADSIDLKENGEYVLRWHEKTYEGRWENDDWNLRLYPDYSNLGFCPRVVKTGWKYRIPTNYKNIDTWDGDLGMR